MECSVEIYGIKLPIIEGKCDLAKVIVDSVRKQGLEFRDGDIVAVTCKIVSKCLGLLVNIGETKPSPKALKIASKSGVNPKFIELLLRESDELLLAIPAKKLADEGTVNIYRFSKRPELARKVLEEYPTVFLVIRDGMLWADAGVDSSNHPPNIYSIPPRNIDTVAKELRGRIRELTGKNVAVVVCDTEVFLVGSLDIARGSYGIEPVDRGFGEPDLYGKPKFGGVDAIVHEACAAAALVMKQTSQGIPVALIRGVSYEKCECGYGDRVGRDIRKQAKALKHIINHTVKVLGIKHVLKTLLTMIKL